MELALSRLLTTERGGRVRECLGALEGGALDPQTIWVARDGPALVAVQVCVRLAGAACLFWLPAGAGDACAAVVRAGLDACRGTGFKLAHALARADEREFAAPLLHAGFRRMTALHQWQHTLTDLPTQVPSPLRFECYRPALAAEFAAVIERTYEATLDCPELNGVRSIDEIMDGHRGQGKFDPAFWWLAYDGARPVGVVLLVEMPDGCTWELAYLGLIPEYRGRRLARVLVTHALHTLSMQPATRLVLAVDERNEPARRLYQSLGFVEIEANEVFLFVF